MASLLKTPATVLVDAGTFEWFYPLLAEGVHYLRAHPSEESVRKMVWWGLTHDLELEKIAHAGRTYAHALLTLNHFATYMAAVVHEYAHHLNDTLPWPRAGLTRAWCGGKE